MIGDFVPATKTESAEQSDFAKHMCHVRLRTVIDRQCLLPINHDGACIWSTEQREPVWSGTWSGPHPSNNDVGETDIVADEPIITVPQ